MKIIDTHTHGYFGHYDANREAVQQDCRNAGIEKQIQIGCDEISSLAAIEMTKQYEGHFATVGLHPCDVAPFMEGKVENHRLKGFENYQSNIKTTDELFSFFESLIKDNPKAVVGLGETGFDRYHDQRDILVDWQAECFVKHLELCQKYDLPVVIHTRNANQELLDFLAQHKHFFKGENKVRGVVHCFVEDDEMAQILHDEYDLYFGIGGVATYNNTEKLAQAIAQMPANRILTETDAPFLPPKMYRKTVNKINSPASLPEVVQKIAEIRATPMAEMAKILYQNAETLFFSK
ncbi:hypothetical protein CSB37_00750 [bacterium DOLZORAL124_38_8]|nr:MAG: hypothetical protein CSB37_00750 [bacterium DOLZORAL124_38_8]